MLAYMAMEKTLVSGSENLFISNDLDYIVDMRLQKLSKRSAFCHGKCEPPSFPASRKPKLTSCEVDNEDPPMDEDYKKFLYILEKYCKEQPWSLKKDEVEEEEEKDEDGDFNIDPQYKMFMENLREDGKSYILEIPVEDAMTLRIKYEGEDDNGNNWAALREVNKSNSATPGGEDEGNSSTAGEDVSISITTGEQVRRDTAIPRAEDRKISATPTREDVSISITTGEQVRRDTAIPRAEDRKISATPTREDMRNLVTPREEDRTPSATPRVDKRDSVTSREKNLSDAFAIRTKDRHTLEVVCSKPKVLKGIEMETSDAINCAFNRPDRTSSVKAKGNSLLFKRQRLDDISGDLLAKRGKIRNNNGGAIIVHARKLATYSGFELENDDDGASADAVKIANSKGLPMSTPFDAHRPWRVKRTIEGDHAQFRQKLMEYLRMPYNQREYEELWQEITYRKPMQRHRDLRGRIIVYDAGSTGKSYLDHHSDLAKKIDIFRLDRAKVLNLLRGFFYWLTNLSHQGAFHPWLDSSCLEVLQDTPSIRWRKVVDKKI